MRSVRFLMVAIVAVAAPLMAAAAVQAAVKVGVVDIVEVTNGYDRTKDANAALQEEMNVLKAATQAKVEAVQKIQVERDSFNKGSPEWKAADDKLLNAQVQVQAESALQQAKIERRHRDLLLDMYRQITTVVDRVAKEKGCDLVFTKAFLAPPQISLDEATGLEDLKNRIMNQRVLYPAPKDTTDLTPDVLKILNGEYKGVKKTLSGDSMPAPAPAKSKG